MNNTPNNQTPTPLRPVRTARRPVGAEPTRAPQNVAAAPQTGSAGVPSVSRPAVRRPQQTAPTPVPPASKPAAPTPVPPASKPIAPTPVPPASKPIAPTPVPPASKPIATTPTAAPQPRPTAVRRPVEPQPRPQVQPPAVPTPRPTPTVIDNTETRPMSLTPPSGRPPVKRDAPPKGSKSADDRPKKKKKQMSEGAATLLSVVKAIVYLVFVIVLAGFLAYAVVQVANDMFAFVKSDEQVTVAIPENATIYDVSEVLADAGIIAYPDIFELYAKIKEDNGLFVAGDYEINGMMNYDELLLAFKEKKIRGTIWLTIPEGYTIDEIIDLFVENGIGGSREDWVEAVNNEELYTDFAFVRALLGNTSSNRTYLLEGYLFPDTYEFYTDAKATQIVYKLLNRFNNVFRDEFYNRADELGFTVDEIITLASMIEKETRRYNEFEQVGSVFHNRLRNAATYPYLESDATIMYAIHHDSGERKEEMEAADTAYVSPYNTYTNRGLPPGPIANPSYQAITCALYPEDTDYYYFVSRKNGETIFSRTFPEHQAAIAQVRAEG